MLWWSPDPRAVLFPGEFRLLAQPRQDAAQSRLRAPASTATSQAVIDGCAAPRAAQPGHLDHAGDARRLPASCTSWACAHSFETWLDGTLVGGLYGVRLGRVFFGESMFSLERDASKVALARLVARTAVAAAWR